MKAKVLSFLKNNAYYFAFIACLAVLAGITVALVTAGNNNSLQTGGNQIEQEGENQTPETPSEPEDNTPTVTVIEFIMPVQGATVIKDYVSASVVYNQTLGLYTGHKAIDFASAEGASVVCVYDGIVESITVSKVEGTTVTVNHGNGLKTVYNSLEVREDLLEGMTLSKGDVIGEVSTNNKTEYLDGAHLHFEVIENGEKIDPEKYLITESK
ncbi:MAG: M23 family metallopeptidase [Clostridia bacterium]|nr:M23 family metallopeptidase [Clostridia bacterium]